MSCILFDNLFQIAIHYKTYFHSKEAFMYHLNYLYSILLDNTSLI